MNEHDPCTVQLVKALAQQIPDEEVAARAADAKAETVTFNCTTKDRFNPEIVIGHVSVSLIFGSELAVSQRVAALHGKEGRS